MPTPQELEKKFWSSLKDDRTVMLGLDGRHDHARPMTALIEEEGHGPIWFFTAKDTTLAESLNGSSPAMIQFVSKGHGLFACVSGTLMSDHDRAVIDRLWNPFIAAWYEEGKDDPKLALLRFEPDEAEIWENASSFAAGIKILLGMDPKEKFDDKVAKVALK